jgi:hypothetical protein
MKILCCDGKDDCGCGGRTFTLLKSATGEIYTKCLTCENTEKLEESTG